MKLRQIKLLKLACMIIILLLVFSTMGAQAQETETPIPQTLAELEQRVKVVMAESDTPGAGIALVSRDEILWVAGFGTADIATGKAVDTDTLFRIGSISKSFVSLAVLQLQEQGKLSLDDTLRDLAPEIAFTNPWEDSAPVRLVHLLEHTSGFDDTHLRELAYNHPTISLQDALAYNPASRTARWPPGTHMSYSNSGPVAAAYVVEKIAGQPFEEFVRENLFEPLAMETADFFLTTAVEARLAKSYQADGVSEIPYAHIIMRPSGAISATPRDMAHFVQMFLNSGRYDGTVILQPKSIARMETPTTTLAAHQGIQAGDGLGNYTTPENGFLFRGHDGEIDGSLASFAYLPEHGVGYMYVINASNGEAFEEIGRLIRTYLVRDLVPPDAPTATIDLKQLQELAGYYEPVTPRRELSRFIERISGIVHVKSRSNQLVVTSILGKPAMLLPVAERHFRGPDDPIATTIFIKDEEAGGWILQAAGGQFGGNFRMIPTWQVWLRWGTATGSLLLMLSSLLFALVWIPRRLLRKIKVQYLSVRVLPMLPILCLIAIAALLISSEDMIQQFGNATGRSVSVCLLSYLLALMSFVGLAQVVRTRRWSVNQGVWVHALLVSLANVIVSLYLIRGGIIGLRTWF